MTKAHQKKIATNQSKIIRERSINIKIDALIIRINNTKVNIV